MTASRKKIIAVIGARPQFIKHYPFELEAKNSFELKTIHTGQHYDENMSKVFFKQLGMSEPDYLLKLGGGSHAKQTGKMLIEIESILISENPDIVVVYGDTNSTLAGALAAAKLNIPIAHIEAGLRSYNREMPEEINRVLTDHLSSVLLVPSEASLNNLSKEGITQGVHVVGDIMKDMIRICKEREMLLKPDISEPYYYVTLHRPYNVDEESRLRYVLNALEQLDQKVIFAAHPRTQLRIKEFGILLDKIEIIDPQAYFENLSYLAFSDALITDSGGMQKEAYWLKKKCMTIRSETEWIETLADGANVLVFENLSEMKLGLKNNSYSFNDNLYGKADAAKQICLTINEIVNTESNNKKYELSRF